MADRKILTLEDIRAAQDVQKEEIEIAEWGGSVIVQGVNVNEGMVLLKQMQKEGSEEIDPEKALLYSVIVGVVEPKFTESDIVWLKTKSMSAVQKITTAFMRLSGFDTKAIAEARKSASA